MSSACEYLVNDNIPRAFVPTDMNNMSRDVQSGSQMDPHLSPFPFALCLFVGVGERGGDNDRARPHMYQIPQPLPLYYVSSAVAKDRDPERNRKNQSGVREGWYVIARPETVFQVRYAVINRKWTGNSLEDLLISQTHVDGVSTKVSVHHRIGHRTGVPMPDVVVDGFCTQFHRTSADHEWNRYKQFKFVKARTGETRSTHRTDVEQGTIRLSVNAAKALRLSANRLWSNLPVNCDDTRPAKLMSEKAVAKEGQSLQVGACENVNLQASISHVVPQQERVWTGAGITIFIREASWMRSRRLIDNRHNPCTLETYEELLKNDRYGMKDGKRGGGGIIDVDDPAKSEPKRENELTGRPTKVRRVSAVSARRAVSIVIDLTGGDEQPGVVKKERTIASRKLPNGPIDHI